MSSQTIAGTDNNNGRFKRFLAALGINSLALSIFVHFLFIAIATVVVVSTFQKKHVNFVASGPPEPPTEVEHKVELTKRNNVDSAPPDLKRIVTTSISTITLPDVPEIPQDTELTPTSMSGASGVMGQGMGGEGSGGGSGGSGSPFGSFDVSTPALTGGLIDLKQTADHQPTGMTPASYHKLLTRFVAENWNPDLLQTYYHSPKQLSTSSLFIPTISAGDGPKAFGVENEVQPNMYVVWYKLTASPTQEGNYHFVGVADDILLVKVNGQTVLDGCLSPIKPDLWHREKRYPQIDFRGSHPTEAAGLFVGTGFHANAGEAVEIEIMIGEEPGGSSNYFVYMQRDETTYQSQANNSPLLPIFQLDTTPLHPKTTPTSCPPYSSDAEPWHAETADSSKL